MKVMITGGGTGGHIYPAIAIADKIKVKQPDTDILFVGTERGLEKTLVPQSGYDIRFITVTGFNRKKLIENWKTFRDLAAGLLEARALIREFMPDLVIGTGGYVCGPVVRAAHKMGVSTFIHEQNAFPGLTNKLLEKHAQKVFIGFEEAKKYFKKKDKVVYTGNPVRKSFYSVDKGEARARLSIDKDEFVILSFGGSQGAARINEVMLQTAETLSGIDGIRMYFVTGRANYDKTLEKCREKGVVMKGNVHVLPYLDDLEQYLAASSIVISRAGALTVSEIAVCGKPAILVPSPNVTGNHQYFNAKALADRGSAILMEEKDFNGEKLIGTLLKLKNNREILYNMSKSVKMASQPDAAEIIYDNLGVSR